MIGIPLLAAMVAMSICKESHQLEDQLAESRLWREKRDLGYAHRCIKENAKACTWDNECCTGQCRLVGPGKRACTCIPDGIQCRFDFECCPRKNGQRWCAVTSKSKDYGKCAVKKRFIEFFMP